MGGWRRRLCGSSANDHINIDQAIVNIINDLYFLRLKTITSNIAAGKSQARTGTTVIAAKASGRRR
jgi:hypothetical protein